MTDEQKELFEFLGTMAERAKEDRIAQIKSLALELKGTCEAFESVGFTNEQAFELVKDIVVNGVKVGK